MQPTLKLSLIALFLAGCASTPSAEKQAEQASNMAGEARATAGGLIKTLGGELKTAMEAGGPAQAISVCKEKAPKIAAEASAKSGMSIKRVSTKNRNPKAVPDAWEAAAIAGFEKRLAAGEKAETLDTYAVVDGANGKTFRYAKALVTQAVCLNCHGAPETMSDAVKAKLAAEYPDDKAVGYAAGMVRGIITMSKPL
jgi:cytochrome c1